MGHYVVGFVVDHDYHNVLLIQKNRPTWQAGLLNGIGGGVERGETSQQALIREIKEETGLDFTNPSHEPCMFSSIATSRGDRVDFWILQTLHSHIKSAISMTDEIVTVCSIENLRYVSTMPNVAWQIQMGLSVLTGKEPTRTFHIVEIE